MKDLIKNYRLINLFSTAANVILSLKISNINFVVNVELKKIENK